MGQAGGLPEGVWDPTGAGQHDGRVRLVQSPGLLRYNQPINLNMSIQWDVVLKISVFLPMYAISRVFPNTGQSFPRIRRNG